MKTKLIAIAAIAGLLLSQTSMAEDKKKDDKKKKSQALIIDTNGLSIIGTDSASAAKLENKKWISSTDFNLGVNMIQDKTNYSDPGVRNYLNVPASKQNADLFRLRQSKSINVNFSLNESFRVINTKAQKMYITTGIGMQIYNLRYAEHITFTKNPSQVILDSTSFTKNKVGIDYLYVPLMLNFKTRIHNNELKPKKSTWLVYGFGITEGFNIHSWTKQKSNAFGKVKERDDFSFAPFNTCLKFELGIDDVIKLYATYQLTSMFSNGIVQHPICIGFKFGSI